MTVAYAQPSYQNIIGPTSAAAGELANATPGQKYFDTTTGLWYVCNEDKTFWIRDYSNVAPGTIATALGKAEDAAHASGDTGVMALTVRKDTAAATAGTDGDYQPPITDANGRLYVIADVLAGSKAWTKATGEVAGNAAATVFPTLACSWVKIKAEYNNAGRVYIGVSGVTKQDGASDTTTGFELSPGEDTGWIPCANMNEFFRICDNAGDDVTYMALI